jgi:hypothetical protein
MIHTISPGPNKHAEKRFHISLNIYGFFPFVNDSPVSTGEEVETVRGRKERENKKD